MMLTRCVLATIIGLGALTAVADDQGQHSANVIRLSEPVHSSESTETFGGLIPDGSEPVTLKQAVMQENKAGLEQVIRTEVARVCQKKGCFFIARQDDVIARISFRDYSFFIPTDAAGKTVTLLGQVQRQTVNEDQAKHLAEDLGVAQAELAPLEYAIVASAIEIPRS